VSRIKEREAACYSTDVIWVIRSSIMERAEHVARIRGNKNAQGILARKYEWMTVFNFRRG
jgi:hypothetical protein